jgi:hypothetical protein
MGVILVKSNVLFTVIAPGGFRILSAIDQCAKKLGDIRLTSACDGEHSGPGDPHHSGNAYDVGSHEFSAERKDLILAQVMNYLGWDYFYGFLESPGTDNEHFHFQVKKGTSYPPMAFDNSNSSVVDILKYREGVNQ